MTPPSTWSLSVQLLLASLLLTLTLSSYAAPTPRLADAVLHGIHPTALSSSRWTANSTFVIDSQRYLRHLPLAPAGGLLPPSPYPWFNVSGFYLMDLAVREDGQVWLYTNSILGSAHNLLLVDPAHSYSVLLNLSFADFTPPLVPLSGRSFLSVYQDRLFVATQTPTGATCHLFSDDGQASGHFDFQLQSGETLINFDVSDDALYLLYYPADQDDPQLDQYSEEGQRLFSQLVDLDFHDYQDDFSVVGNVAWFPVASLGREGGLTLWAWDMMKTKGLGTVVTQLSDTFKGWTTATYNDSVLICSEEYGQCELVPGVTNSSHVLYSDEQSRLFDPLEVHYIPQSQALVVARQMPVRDRVVVVHPRQCQVEYSFFGPPWQPYVDNEYVAVDQRTSWVYLLHYSAGDGTDAGVVQVFDATAAFVRQFNVSLKGVAFEAIAMVVDSVNEVLIIFPLENRPILRYHLNGTFINQSDCSAAEFSLSWAVVHNRSVLVTPDVDKRILQLLDAVTCSVVDTVSTAPYQPVLAEADGSGGWWVVGKYCADGFDCVVHFDSAGQVVEVLTTAAGLPQSFNGLAVSADGSVWVVTVEESFLYQWLSPNAVSAASSSSSSSSALLPSSSSSSSSGSLSLLSSSVSSSSAAAADTATSTFSSLSALASSSVPSQWSSTSSSLTVSFSSTGSGDSSATEGWSTQAVVLLCLGFAVVGAVLALLIDSAVRVCGREKTAAASDSGRDELQAPMLAHVGGRARRARV